MDQHLKFTISPEDHGRRIDQVLSGRLDDWSRSKTQRAIVQGMALINGDPSSPSQCVHTGDEVVFHIEPESLPQELSAEEGENIPILYEDEHLLVVNKPHGILSHPNPGHQSGSILNQLLRQGFHVAGGEDPMRKGLVHRLDRDTSGVMILSKHEECYRKLQQAFHDRLVHKRYQCLSSGKVTRMEFHCELRLSRNPKRRTLRMVDPEGREAVTHFKCIARYNQGRHHLIEAKPVTGRTHQIRIHLKECCLPILGDPSYGRADIPIQLRPLIKRTLLHCCEMELPHPFVEKNVVFSCPLPADFLAVQEALQQM